ncbi:MAG: glycosyltransferase family 4 protein [Deltaproteobacteria bacterium]|nr:glycosyltransferase family 4 protein [Desulfitobacteriaceae bacterium]MDI6854782.1 glycosyltransferase family 4 protein [Deltaproteobacteria bacterium]
MATKLKILVVNKYFYIRGGAEKVFFDEVSLLEQKGHEIGVFSMEHPRNAPSRYAPFFVSGVDYEGKMGTWQKLWEAGRILYSLEAKKKMRRLLQQEHFDLVHLHNIYHQISPSILDAIATAGLPAVMTLHDYKMVCPTYSLLADKRVCECCFQGRYFHSLWRRCAKDSYAKSFLSMAEMYLHHRLLKIYGKVALFIAPSRFLKAKVEESGFPYRIIHLPYFLNARDYQPNFISEEQSLVYFGRLSPEKGLETLIKAMSGVPANLKIIGEGPQRPRLEYLAGQLRLNNVQFLGYRQGDALFDEIKKSRFTVLPSEWYENYPVSVLESFALGKPVVGARIGGIPELVRDHDTGLTFEPGNIQDLQEKICFLMEEPDVITAMGKRARQFVEEVADPERHYQKLLKIYHLVIDSHLKETFKQSKIS